MVHASSGAIEDLAIYLFCSNQKGCDAKQLKDVMRDGSCDKEAIENVDCQEECVLCKDKSVVEFSQPFYQSPTHTWCDLIEEI